MLSIYSKPWTRRFLYSPSSMILGACLVRCHHFYFRLIDKLLFLPNQSVPGGYHELFAVVSGQGPVKIIEFVRDLETFEFKKSRVRAVLSGVDSLKNPTLCKV
jgi:hypothetical protein